MGSSRHRELLTRLHDVKVYGDLNGESAEKHDNLHRLFMYPAMMVPVTQSLIIEAISGALPTNALAIDPYMGSGTSLLSCMEYGIGVFGQDINPMAVLLVNAKTASYNIDNLENSLKEISQRIYFDSKTSVDIDFPGINKWFTKEIQQDLSKIRRNIIAEKNQSIRYLYWVVMAEVIRLGSNDRTSTFKLHQRTSEDIAKRKVNVISVFCDLCKRSIFDLKLFKEKLERKELIENHNYSKPLKISWGNSLVKIQSDSKFDLLVSSPPYGDNHTTVTYGQHSYLQLQWIDQRDLDSNIDYEYLKTTQEIDRQSLGGKINSRKILKTLPNTISRIPSLKVFYESIPNKERPLYFKTISFIQDFEQSLSTIMESMNQDAFYIWTIGNRNVNKREIPNDSILIDLMNNEGIKLIFDAEREILNKKQAKRNRSSKTMEKERILIFQRQNK